MEFLNNIWTAISTPNEGLINILAVPLTLIENILAMYLFTYLLNIKATKKQKLLYILLSYSCSIITLNFIPAPYNWFANYIILFIGILIIFKLSIIKSLIALISPIITFSLVVLFALNPITKISHLDYAIAQTIPIYRISFLLFTYFLIFLIILIIKNKNLYFNILDEFDKKTKIILAVSLLLGIVALSTQLSIIEHYTNELPIIISFLSFLSLIAFVIMSIYTITRLVKLTLTTKQLQNAEEYNKTLQILHDNIRCFKHDYDNTVATIGGYINTDDMDGLKNYYKELGEECLKVNRLYMINPNIINNPAIYSLLATKYHQADELNIKMNLSVLMDLNTINMKMYEFTKILGILLDNSIEASKECENKIINILFKNDEKNNRQLLIIENTYLNKNIDINKIFEKGVTEKENHTGLGLWEIRKILKRNNNLNLYTTNDDKYFKQQLEIYQN